MTSNLYEIVRKCALASELIRELDAFIPSCHPTITMTDREIWMRVGRRDLIESLVTVLTELEREQTNP